MNSVIYTLEMFDSFEERFSDALLIMAIDNEERSIHALKRIAERKEGIKDIIVLYYNEEDLQQKKFCDLMNDIRMKTDYKKIFLPKPQLHYIESLRKEININAYSKIIIDISSVLTPFLFLTMMYIRATNPNAEIYVINTIPFDYSFLGSPFEEFKYHYGDLKMEELLGFSGADGNLTDNDLFIFSGFEGPLSLIAEEETLYKNLFIINALPGYHQKYKDISLVSNYKLLSSKKHKRIYAPSENPFEVYNILDKYIDSNKGASIVPLCTKPTSLGICMYAIDHPDVRVLYPFSDEYGFERSRGVYKSVIYSI